MVPMALGLQLPMKAFSIEMPCDHFPCKRERFRNVNTLPHQQIVNETSRYHEKENPNSLNPLINDVNNKKTSR